MIAVAGTLVADIVLRSVPQWPEKGGVVCVDLIQANHGGAVANTGLALERMGIPVTALATVGGDDLGIMVRSKVSTWATHNAVGVDASSRTTACIVAVAEDGDRSFIVMAGACDRFVLTEAQVEQVILSGSRALHVGYALLLPAFDGERLRRALRRAGTLGALTSLDVSWHKSDQWPSLLTVLPEIDVFCPNLAEAQAITGKTEPMQAAAALVAAGVRKFVAVTDGNRGAYVHVVGEGQEHLPALPVNVADTTGAGDCFVAGVLAAWYRGFPWRTAARIGIGAAALAVASPERYQHLRSWAQVLERCQAARERGPGASGARCV
ncbi:MAG TPA: carbohydrate kinase family protein [Chthoniobacterales bacterium]